MKNWLADIEKDFIVVNDMYLFGNVAVKLANLDEDKNANLTDYKNMQKKGVHLITVFPHELDRQDQYRNYIKSVLKIHSQKIHARKCRISEIDRQKAKAFFNEYHIQGANNLGIVFFGLFHLEELVGVLSLGRHHRQIKDNAIVLDRLCFKEGIQIVGGASKLFKRAVEWSELHGYESIVSFSDNRWSLGGVYYALNFTLEKDYPPDYSYLDTYGNYLSKQSQKKQLVECPAELTEKEWAAKRGLKRIWDCGKKRWVFQLADTTEIKKHNKEKKSSALRVKKHYEKHIKNDKITVPCAFCGEEHTIMQLSYDLNVKKNGRFICIKENGSIMGKKPKDHLRKDNPYASLGQKQCTKCSRILPFECFGSDKSRRDNYASRCKECRK